jgi:hypothetical protein
MKPARKDWPHLAKAVDESGIITWDELTDLSTHGGWIKLMWPGETRTREIRVMIPQPGNDWFVRAET